MSTGHYSSLCRVVAGAAAGGLAAGVAAGGLVAAGLAARALWAAGVTGVATGAAAAGAGAGGAGGVLGTGSGGIYQPGQTAGAPGAATNGMNWGTHPAQSFNTPVLNALYNAQQQRMLVPAPTFNFQSQQQQPQGALTQIGIANTDPAQYGDPPVVGDWGAGGTAPGGLTQAIAGG